MLGKVGEGVICILKWNTKLSKNCQRATIDFALTFQHVHVQCEWTYFKDMNFYFWCELFFIL